jgi:serine phosphatase RsbU (regulator of sigma subunit)
VGGDFYDFLSRDEESLTGVLADVSGKGVSAALLSSFTLGVLETECRDGVALSDALNRTNKRLFHKTRSNRFVTLFLFSLERDGTGEYLSAGHNPAYLYRAATSQVEELASDGLILGAFEYATYQSIPFRLHAGDILLVYTDGVTEAENPAGKMFGEKRLMKLLGNHAKKGGAGLQDQIQRAVTRFTESMDQTDDITFMLVEHCGD